MQVVERLPCSSTASLHPRHHSNAPGPHLPQRAALAARAAAHAAQHCGQLRKQHQLQQLDAHAQRLHHRSRVAGRQSEVVASTAAAVHMAAGSHAMGQLAHASPASPPTQPTPSLCQPALSSHVLPRACEPSGSEPRAQVCRGPPDQSQGRAQMCQACGAHVHVRTREYMRRVSRLMHFSSSTTCCHWRHAKASGC